MTKLFVKNISLLSLVLVAASAVTAAVVPDKSDAKRVNNGTLRNFSVTGAGIDRDAPQDVWSCLAQSQAVSCTATNPTATTTGTIFNDSVVEIRMEEYYQTLNNTSQTAAISGDQNSVLQEVII